MRQLGPTGKAHLRRALLGQEAALQLHAVCRALRREDLLQAVLARTLQRSLAKYSELDLEDDFHEATEAPDIQREHRPGPGVGVSWPQRRCQAEAPAIKVHGPHREPSERAAMTAPCCSVPAPSPQGRQTPTPPGSSCWWCPEGPECMVALRATTLGP